MSLGSRLCALVQNTKESYALNWDLVSIISSDT